MNQLPVKPVFIADDYDLQDDDPLIREAQSDINQIIIHEHEPVINSRRIKQQARIKKPGLND